MSTPPPWPPPPPPPLPSGPARAAGVPAPVPVPPPRQISSTVPIVILVVVGVFGGVVLLGIISAIAIPGLLRARMSGNEASAIGSLRAMTSAQAAWAGSHAGRFAAPSCLGQPAICGETQTGSLLANEIASLQPRSGYEFGFVLRPSPDDPPVAEDGVGAGVSSPGTPTDAEVQAQLEQFSTPDTGAEAAAPPATPRLPTGAIDPGGFVYWASPANPRSTGSRRFCTDQSGVVLGYDVQDRWTTPTADQPMCPDGGEPLR